MESARGLAEDQVALPTGHYQKQGLPVLGGSQDPVAGRREGQYGVHCNCNFPFSLPLSLSLSSSRDNHSYNVTVSLLTQSFSSLVRLITELQSTISIDGPHPPFVLQPLPSDRKEVHVEKHKCIRVYVTVY